MFCCNARFHHVLLQWTPHVTTFPALCDTGIVKVLSQWQENISPPTPCSHTVPLRHAGQRTPRVRSNSTHLRTLQRSNAMFAPRRSDAMFAPRWSNAMFAPRWSNAMFAPRRSDAMFAFYMHASLGRQRNAWYVCVSTCVPKATCMCLGTHLFTFAFV